MPEGSDQDESQSDKGEKDAVEGLHDVVIDGEKSQVSTADLVAGYQQNGHFTQKSQGLAERERNLDKLIEDKATALYQDAWTQQQDKGKDKDAEDLSNDDKFRKELDDLRSEVTESRKSAADKEADVRLDSMTKVLKEKYPNADMDKVMINFYNKGNEVDKIEDQFETFAKESHESHAKYRQEVIDGYLKEKRENVLGSGEMGFSKGSGAVKPIEKAKTFEEARANADRRLGINQHVE